MIKQHNPYFDFLRGIAIIMVVGIHTLPPISGYNTVAEIAAIMVRQILNCAVPLFLAISGFFIARKDLSSGKNIKEFWKKQIPTVYIPCMLWSVGWFILDVFMKDSSNPVVKIVQLVICGFSVYYFIALIIQMYILTPWLLRINNSGGGNLRGIDFSRVNNCGYLHDAD